MWNRKGCGGAAGRTFRDVAVAQRGLGHGSSALCLQTVDQLCPARSGSAQLPSDSACCRRRRRNLGQPSPAPAASATPTAFTQSRRSDSTPASAAPTPIMVLLPLSLIHI